jgi:uncharacterized protein involved in type VI secretion and phage assembly
MQETLMRVAKAQEQKRYGKFRAVVVDNQDPQKRGRLKLRVPSVLADQETDWALPCMPFGGGAAYGWFAIPEVDAQVWVEFEEGDITKPIWVGTFWQQADQVPEPAQLDEPTTRLFQTPAGHLLQFDDEDGKERTLLFHPKEAQLEIDEKGTIVLTDGGGSTLTMDADAGEVVVEDSNGNTLTMGSSGTTVEDSNGNKIEMAASGITLEGQQVVVKGSTVMLAGQGGEPIIKGQSFLTLFATHMHPTAMGPSGPPIPQGEMSTLSTKVLTS